MACQNSKCIEKIKCSKKDNGTKISMNIDLIVCMENFSMNKIRKEGREEKMLIDLMT